MASQSECYNVSKVNVTRQPGKTFSLTWYGSNISTVVDVFFSICLKKCCELFIVT